LSASCATLEGRRLGGFGRAWVLPLRKQTRQKCDEVCLSVINGAIPENW
jgi:hypothetical protein